MHTLLIDCQDQIGLVHSITEVLLKYRLNITSNDEYVDGENAHFFMRTEFSGDFEQDDLLRDIVAVIPNGANIKLNPKKKKDIVILVTKEHHCLGDLLIRYSYGELNANVLAVIGNYNDLQPLAAKFGIPFHYISHKDKSREQHELEITRALQIYEPEFLVLAKFMRILSPNFVARFYNRIINIHHSFLPAFVGANPYRQAYDRGVKIIGATAHFVNNDLDEGPIIEQNVIRVNHRQNVKDMARAGREVERDVLASALRNVFEDRVVINKNKTVVF